MSPWSSNATLIKRVWAHCPSYVQSCFSYVICVTLIDNTGYGTDYRWTHLTLVIVNTQWPPLSDFTCGFINIVQACRSQNCNINQDYVVKGDVTNREDDVSFPVTKLVVNLVAANVSKNTAGAVRKRHNTTGSCDVDFTIKAIKDKKTKGIYYGLLSKFWPEVYS